MASKLDEKTRRAFEEGLAHLQMAQKWKEQQDANRREKALKNARKSFDKVVGRDPQFDEGWVQLARVYSELRDFRLVQFILDKALEHTPRSVSALTAKAKVLEKIGSFLEASRIYGRLHRIDPAAGFDEQQQQVLAKIIEHEQRQPLLPETEEVLHQLKPITFAWNGIEAKDATLTVTTTRIICIGTKVPEHEQGIQPRRILRRRPPSTSTLDRKEELHVLFPLDMVETAQNVQFYARRSLHLWDLEENHLVLLDLLDSDFDSILSLLGEREIKAGEIQAKICTLFLVMFVGSLLLSVALLL